MPLLTWLSDHALILLLGCGTLFNVYWLHRCRERLHLRWLSVLLLSVLVGSLVVAQISPSVWSACSVSPQVQLRWCWASFRGSQSPKECVCAGGFGGVGVLLMQL